MEPSLRSRKQKKREEAAAMLKAALESPADNTGRVRCLSCGAIFASHEALAGHLTKHGGINALDYRPSNIVAATNGNYRNAPIERPALLLKDAVFEAMRRPKQQEKHKITSMQRRGHPFSGKGSTTAVDVKGKQHKATATKRSILIHQVLSLNQKLAALHRELDVLKSTIDPTSLDTETKKQMKKIQGCINASETELHMALTAVNRKFTFRQLVMIEYLTCQLEEWIPSNDQSPGPPAVDDVVAMEMVDETDLHLFDEAEALLNEMDVERAKTASESSRRIDARKDPDTGKMYIIKPSFLECPNPSEKLPEMIGRPLQQVVDETVGEMPEEAWPDDRDDDDDFQNVGGTSSDDDMWGFSNVLVEWAHAAKHKNQQPFSSVSPLREPSFDLESETASVIEDGYIDTIDNDMDVRVVHTSKNTIELEHPATDRPLSVDRRSIPMAKDASWVDASEAIDGSEAVGKWESKSRCLFIKPHLGIQERTNARLSPGMSRNRNTKREKALLGNGCNTGGGNGPIRSDFDPAMPTGHPKLLDDAVYALLQQLNAKQHESMKTNKSRQRWMVTGFSEVGKHLARGSVRLLIIARHLDITVQSKISEIEAVAKAADVPIVHALTRKKIGQIYHPRKRMSIVAVLDIQDLEEPFSVVIQMGHMQS